MNEYLKLQASIGEVEKKINITFENKDLLLLSFVHRSFFNENKKVIQEHNERLEFLGDAALSLVVSHYLYSRFPNYPESLGQSTVLRHSTHLSETQKLELSKSCVH